MDARSRPDPPSWSSLASFRDWLIGPSVTAEEEAAFDAYTRELTIRFWPGLGLLLAAAALLWWPIDGLVYPEESRIRAAFADFRVRIAVLDVTFALVLPRLAFTRRHAHLVATSAALANLAFAGWFLAGAGEGSVEWFHFAFMTPVYSVLLLVPLRARVWVTIAFSAVIVGAWLAHPLSSVATPGIGAGISYLVFLTGLGIFIGHLLYVQVQRSFHLGRRVEHQRLELADLALRLEERVAAQTEVIRDLSARAQQVRAEQRLEIGRELHDGLGQELTSMRLLVDLGLRLHRDDEGVREAFQSLGEQIRRIQGSLRQVLVSLSPQPLEDGSIVEALTVLVGEIERRSGLSCRFTHEGVPDTLPPALSLALYRVAQEGLTNAIRHARARRVDLRLRGRGDALVLEVRDDGGGIDPAHVGLGFGTRGIIERAEGLGGRATWTDEAGTCLTVSLPLRRSA